MAKPKNKGTTSHAVMAQRHEAADSLDFFPTPPWATRAFFEDVFLEKQGFPSNHTTWRTRPWFGSHQLHDGDGPIPGLSIWDPAAGEGHMTEVQREYVGEVYASDVFDYGKGYDLGSFVGQGADIARLPKPVDLIVTNPPFNLAVDFVERGLEEAKMAVAMLLRTVWVEGKDRYNRLFLPRQPDLIAQYSERVPMTKGGWDPDASTATAYAWFIWITDPKFRGVPSFPGITPTMWIPYGAERRYTKIDDRARFARIKPPEPVDESYLGLFDPAPSM
ncbi:hypothetical protein [Bosea sp. RAC05]|uniref:hypothetical protein n=1 Tax=Bosea sp. RAC05 TaxID=1842539 RepID=UPI000858A806|nr:hypothetical protein [Bosea sp. RAC05]AOG03079.1 hypothetical protein BSY19_5016 [Bosea sp. RAC05]